MFGIDLLPSANTPGFDGRFQSGPLQGRTVNVKWHLQRDGMLDINVSDALDDYLVMTGPAGAAVSSYGQTRPWRVDHVYLFDADAVRADLLERGIQIGAAASVRAQLWGAAGIYPNGANERLPLTAHRIEVLQWFHPDGAPC
ncbi:hypothetical protein [Geodermatophilus sp. URMC 62]|uniref:hypothetical protein n=1 Tax=Geodermatophilus sp. URMC 62 TaxID=3423414 RepID=UPI00406C964A